MHLMTLVFGSVDASTDSKLESYDASTDPNNRVSECILGLQFLGRWMHPRTLIFVYVYGYKDSSLESVYASTNSSLESVDASQNSKLYSLDASTDTNYRVGRCIHRLKFRVCLCIHRPKHQSPMMHPHTQKLESQDASKDSIIWVGG